MSFARGLVIVLIVVFLVGLAKSSVPASDSGMVADELSDKLSDKLSVRKGALLALVIIGVALLVLIVAGARVLALQVICRMPRSKAKEWLKCSSFLANRDYRELFAELNPQESAWIKTYE